jgi:Iap family predicted aminopeptidase
MLIYQFFFPFSFLLCCEALQDIREPLIKRIIDVGSEVLAKIKSANRYTKTYYKSAFSNIGVHVWLSNFSIVTLEVDFLDMYMDP